MPALSFQVTVNAAAPFPGPVLCNTAGLGFGPAAPAVTAQDCDVVTGNNTPRGTVFRDDGDGRRRSTATARRTAARRGSAPGVAVQLYYDVNGDGQPRRAATCCTRGTTTAATGPTASPRSRTAPTSSSRKKYDGAAARRVNDVATDAAFVTTGWGNTTYDPNLPLTTDQGILKLDEDLNRVGLAVNVDYSRDSGAADGHGRQLRLRPAAAPDQVRARATPTLNVDGRADTTIDEGDLFTLHDHPREPPAERRAAGADRVRVHGLGRRRARPASSPKDFTNPGNA